jgi:hypothetical protein
MLSGSAIKCLGIAIFSVIVVAPSLPARGEQLAMQDRQDPVRFDTFIGG